MMKKNRFLKVWGLPSILGVLTLVGLVLALVKDGILDIVACAILLIPIIILLKNYYFKK
ncbi:hypothetical protein [Soonwooa sp.]|uniref:hypothetical protein n=1 Tax=Soonwooa sp. TaxID=1938592 RepID=UPI002633C013|nr:hypothetical protein [Soonwooa sp.]